MDTLALFAGVLLCLTVISGRSLENGRGGDPVSEADDERHERHGSARYRRRPDKSQNDNKQRVLQNIVKLLEDISVSFDKIDQIRQVKRPPSKVKHDTVDIDKLKHNQGEDNGSRPISFDKIEPSRPVNRPAPKVEHGSVQDSALSSEASNANEGSVREMPRICDSAVLSCCHGDKKQIEQCFNTFRCGFHKNACSEESVFAAIEMFQRAYSPLPAR